MKDWDAETAAAMGDDEPAELSEEEFLLATGGGQNMVAPSPPLFIVVFGSMSWDEPVVVQAALLAWQQHHLGRRVNLITTGAPGGAEEEARQVAERNGWATMVIDVTELTGMQIPIAASFAFVTQDSDALAFSAEYGSRYPLRRFMVETIQPQNRRWARW